MRDNPSTFGRGDMIALGSGHAADIRVSALGLGAWQWGDRVMWGYGSGYAAAEVRGAFEASLRAGINWVDTAEVYGMGKSERLLGQFVRESNADILTATKFFPMPWRLRRGALLDALRASLRRLDMQRVDLYQMHWPVPLVSTETWMEAMADAVSAGLTRAVGVSNFNLDQTRRAHAALARRGVALASNQVEYSLLQRGPERNGLLNACGEMGVTLIAYSPLAKGMLSGKYTPDNPPPGARRRLYPPARLAAVQPLVGLLREVGQAHGGKTPSQVALNWAICKGALPIPGAKNAAQAQDNAGALGWRLTADEVAGLDEASEAAD